MNKKCFFPVLILPLLPIVTLPISCDNKKIVKHNILFENKNEFSYFSFNDKNVSFSELIQKSNIKEWEENKFLPTIDNFQTFYADNFEKIGISKENAKRFLISKINTYLNQNLGFSLSEKKLNEFLHNNKNAMSKIYVHDRLKIISTYDDYLKHTKKYWINDSKLDKIKEKLDNKYTKEYFKNRSLILMNALSLIYVKNHKNKQLIQRINISNIKYNKNNTYIESIIEFKVLSNKITDETYVSKYKVIEIEKNNVILPNNIFLTTNCYTVKIAQEFLK